MSIRLTLNADSFEDVKKQWTRLQWLATNAGLEIVCWVESVCIHIVTGQEDQKQMERAFTTAKDTGQDRANYDRASLSADGG